jgi:hypothetical protein
VHARNARSQRSTLFVLRSHVFSRLSSSIQSGNRNKITITSVHAQRRSPGDPFVQNSWLMFALCCLPC